MRTGNIWFHGITKPGALQEFISAQELHKFTMCGYGWETNNYFLIELQNTTKTAHAFDLGKRMVLRKYLKYYPTSMHYAVLD